MRTRTILTAVLCYCFYYTGAQTIFQQYNAALFTDPLSYTARHTTRGIQIDGRISEADWQQAAWSAPFTDIEGTLKPAPALNTQVKMLWDNTCLYVAARLREPHLQGTLRQRDAIVFHDNDFELFIDADNDTHEYVEIEVNTLNTLFDLFLPKPYRNGGDAWVGYDVPALRSAIRLQGTLEQPADRDSGWTVEMAIPLRTLNRGYKKTYTPEAGSFYRINFSRVEWDWDAVQGHYTKKLDAKGSALPEHNWVWSPQGVVNMHYPERWGYVFFSRDADSVYTVPAVEAAKKYLWLLYYRQQDFYQKSGQYATTLSALVLPDSFSTTDREYRLSLTATPLQFTGIIENRERWSIDQEGRIKRLK